MQVYDIENITLLNSEAEDLPFDDAYFDLIVSNNGINNVKEMEHVFQEISRTSTPGAQFVFTMNTAETMHQFYDSFEAVLNESGRPGEIDAMKQQIYSKRRPIEEIKDLVINSEFTIEHIYYDDFVLSFVDSATMFRHPLIKYWFLDGWKNIIAQEFQDDVFSKIESRMDARMNGNLHLSVPFVTFDCRRNDEN